MRTFPSEVYETLLDVLQEEADRLSLTRERALAIAPEMADQMPGATDAVQETADERREKAG